MDLVEGHFFFFFFTFLLLKRGIRNWLFGLLLKSQLELRVHCWAHISSWNWPYGCVSSVWGPFTDFAFYFGL